MAKNRSKKEFELYGWHIVDATPPQEEEDDADMVLPDFRDAGSVVRSSSIFYGDELTAEMEAQNALEKAQRDSDRATHYLVYKVVKACRQVPDYQEVEPNELGDLY